MFTNMGVSGYFAKRLRTIILPLKLFNPSKSQFCSAQMIEVRPRRLVAKQSLAAPLGRQG